MSTLRGIIRKQSGSVGDFTFKQVNGQTIVSEKVTVVKNPRTEAQMKTRTKWGNIIQMYKGIRPLLNNGFESKANNQSDYNMFVKLNMQRTPVYLTKDQVSGGACVAAPYQITQGSLPSIVCDAETGFSASTDIKLGTLEISATTTIGDLSKAVVQNNAQYKYGDQLSYFTVLQHINEATGIPYCDFKAYAVILDASDTDKLYDKVLKNGFATIDGYLGHGSTEGDFAYCWVHSRKSSNKTLVSSQALIVNNTKLADYTSDTAFTSASKSYGTTTSAFLSPDSDSTSGEATGGGGSSSSDDSI